MPWLSTPCRSAQDRLSAVAAALSSGIPQANGMALSWAGCFSYGAGMGVSSGRRSPLRDSVGPARVEFYAGADGHQTIRSSISTSYGGMAFAEHRPARPADPG